MRITGSAMARSPAWLLLVLSGGVMADDVRLPAPVLQWSFYIFLIFALSVAIGIFFLRKRRGLVNEPLTSAVIQPFAQVYSVAPETSVADCARRMKEKQIGAVLVMENSRLVGILSERDCVNRVIASGLDAGATKVADVMTRDPACVAPDTSLYDAIEIVTNYRVRHLPVVENDEIVGVVSARDLLFRLAARERNLGTDLRAGGANGDL